MLKKNVNRVHFVDFFRYFLRVIYPYRFIYLSVTMLMLLCAAVSYVLPLTERKLINVLTQQDKLSNKDVWGLVIVIVAMTVFLRFESMFQSLLINSTVQKVIYTLKKQITHRLLELPPSLIHKIGGGYLAGRIYADIHQIQTFFSNTFFSSILSIMKICGALVFLCILNWYAGVLVLLVFPCYFFLMMKYRNRHYLLVKQNSENLAKNQQKMSNTFGKINLVKSHVAEEKAESSIQKGFARETISKIHSIQTANAFVFFSNLVPFFAQGILMLAGVYFILEKQWTLGELWALNRYMMNVFTPLNQFSSSFLLYQTALASVSRLIELEHNTAEYNYDKGEKPAALSGEIELRDLSFCYHKNNPIFEHANLLIHSGEHVVLMGKSGSGKSTLLALLLGFYSPEHGNVLIDGRPLTEYNIRAIRRKIGYIGATTELMHASVRDNLKFGLKINVSDEKIQYVLQQVSLWDKMNSLPQKLDTVVEESQASFSTGEQLRLALARELLRGCDLLLLDEATANLDEENETNFLRMIITTFQNKTLLMIRHTPHRLVDHLPHILLREHNFFREKTSD